MKKKMVTIMLILLVLFIVPVFAKGTVSIEKLTGTTKHENVILNDAQKVDVSFNDLKQDATYKVELKNTTEDILYVNDLVVENLSENFIDFSLTDKSFNAALNPGTTKEIEFVVSTLDITGAGRNVNDEVKLTFVLGDSIKNPVTSSELLILYALILILLITGTITFKKMNKKKVTALFIFSIILTGTMIVSAKDSLNIELTGKVTYTSQNLMQSSGTVLDKYKLSYANAVDIWKYTDQVKNIVISDDKIKPEEYEYRYDLSTTNSKRIYGYIVDNGDSKTPYDLYIVSNGIIYAPEDATGLFAFPNVEKITGLELVEFENTKNMSAMFMGNEKLSDANVKSINTSNAVNTSYMFNDCNNLNVKEKDFNLTKVTNKNYMFNETLYNVVKLNAVSDKNTDFSVTPVTGKYMIESTKNDVNPVYYYSGNVSDNNILFGGYCWKMVRTTDTGGVKLIYNGTPVTGYTPISSTEYMNVKNTSSIPFEFDSSSLKWISKNKSHNSNSNLSFNILTAGNYVINYTVSSENNYDLAWFYKNGTLLNKVSGTKSGTINLGYITVSDKIEVKYSKDGSANYGNDNIVFFISKGNEVKSTCNNTGTSTEIGTSKFNSNVNSISYNGYMYGIVYNRVQKNNSDILVGTIFGNDVEYKNGKYKLLDTQATTQLFDSSYAITDKHHYTCFTSSSECETVYYVYYTTPTDGTYYISLTNGKNISDVLDESFKESSNDNSSTIKSVVDEWYENNLVDYKNQIEDTIWCNDRTVYSEGAWNKDGNITDYLVYSSYKRTIKEYKPQLKCNEISDSFTVDKRYGNGNLTYPIGLLTADELLLAGARYNINNSNIYLYSNSNWWTMSPSNFYFYNPGTFYMSTGNGLYRKNNGNNYGVRPAISLKSNVSYVYGTGTVNDPYIVE